MTQHIGILTSGGDSPGLNAAIRAIGKAARTSFDMDVIGFRQGFRGLMENHTMTLDDDTLSGILTLGGTILGTSRDKPHKMPVDGQERDMRDRIVEVYREHRLDALVCLGGGGTQKNALKLKEMGLNIVTLPKTIDNDVAMTDITFGFDTALGIATDAIDRLHSTAHSHHRIILVEIMGNKVGWLALGAGLAGGADVILIPEIVYDPEVAAEAILRRVRRGKHFSIVAVAEGAMPQGCGDAWKAADERRQNAPDKATRQAAKQELAALKLEHEGHTMKLAHQLEALTGLEARVTILGYLQRGGTPSAADRVLATRLGTACARLIHGGVSGVMIASQGGKSVPVPLEEVAGKRKTVPLDHPWVNCARQTGVCLGDK